MTTTTTQTNRQLISAIKRTVDELDRWYDERDELMQRVRCFQTAERNPYREDMIESNQRRLDLSERFEDQVMKAFYAGVRKSTIKRICGGHLRSHKLNYLVL